MGKDKGASVQGLKYTHKHTHTYIYIYIYIYRSTCLLSTSCTFDAQVFYFHRTAPDFVVDLMDISLVVAI